MKKLSILAVAAISLMASCTGGGSESTAIKTQSDSLSNAIGSLMGMQIKSMIKNETLNSKIIAQAIDQVMATKDDKELEGLVSNADNFFRNYMTVIVPAKKKEIEEKFLAEKSKKSGVIKTESGLLYEIIEPGDANLKPTPENTIVAHYKGSLADGSEFDSSYKRGEPLTLQLKNVIKGWTEGLQLIGKGGKIKLYIPCELAYGTQHPQLGNEALEFEIELIDVTKPE